MKKFLLFLWLVLGTTVCFAESVGYADIDAYAQNAPPLKTETGLPKLVNYLVKPFKGEVAKARVILAWIVYNINYDRERLKRIAAGQEEGDMEISLDVEIDSKTGEVTLKRGDVKMLHTEDTIQKTLRTRKGICKDIAKLYQHMCRLAGLEVEIIAGYACADREDSRVFDAHMWTAVKINGIWYFVDPTWAAEGYRIYVSSESEAKKLERQIQRGKGMDKIKGAEKVVLDDWFLVGREKMIETHFPIERKWQLQKRRVPFEDFLKKSCHTTLKEFVNLR